MTYPFVAAGAPDYGVRRGPILGLLFHMAEGGGTVGYLSHHGVPRGVSVHAVCEYNGKVTQMVDWHHASGSLNPADRSTDKPYFGQKHLMDVLGSWWTDPNSVVLSMEIEGFAAKGPNPAQVDGAVAWGVDMIGRFPTLRGALGHADQTNTKACPGTSLSMRLVFEGVGGHGLWHPQGGSVQTPEEPDMATFEPYDGLFACPVGTPVYAGPIVTPDPLSTVRANEAYIDGALRVIGKGSAATQSLGWRVCIVNAKTAAWIPANEGTDKPAPPPVTADCTDQVNAALDHVAGPASAVSAAIQEARPR